MAVSQNEKMEGFDLDLALEGVVMRGDTAEMENLIKSIGKQLEKTKESLSSNWQDFSATTQQTLETNITSIKGISQFFQEKMKLEKQECTTEPMNLNVFLNNVVQALERNVGQEEKIFDDLINFSAEQGLILPAAQPESNSTINQSTASLNVVFSQDEENMSSSWEKIRKMICCGLLSSIDKLGLPEKDGKIKLSTKKVALLEKLCVLYLPSDVWRKYLGLRKTQIERFLSNAASLGDFGGLMECLLVDDVPTGVVSLVRVSHALAAMLEEDYSLLGVGMFPDALQLQPDEIFTVYLSAFGNELREVIKNLHSLSRRSSIKQGDSSLTAVLLPEIFLALRHCVLAASSVDNAAKKLLSSLHFCSKMPKSFGPVDSRFGSTASIPTSPVDANNSNEDSSLGKVVRDEPDEDNEDIWCWQDEFKPVVSKLALVIVENMQLVTRTALENELHEYNMNRKYEVIKINDEKFNDYFDCPKQVAKSCQIITEKTDELLSFLLLRPGKEFDAIKTSLIECLATSFMAYHSRLVQMSSDVPKNALIRNLYLAFNSALFIKYTLKQYEEDYREITGSLCSLYSDLVNCLHEKIISYHYNSIATVILQDVTSHHWINQKEFFEGERCSFSIQMWNYYMQGFQHDLWKMCAPQKAQAIFTSVLQYSLSCLVRRYSKAIPTYKRTTLLRLDITSLLFSVSSWLIFTISTSSTDIFNPDPTRDAVNDIHNSCSALLAIMTIISCPLETLCLFTSGGAEELVKDGLGTTTSWLSWLQPELYGEHCKSISSLNDIQAVNVYFKLMISQPKPVWGLVLQTLLLSNAYLAVTIVTYLETHFIHLHIDDTAERKGRVQFQEQCQVTNDQEPQEHCQSIVGSLYYVIFQCCTSSKPVVNFIVALMNRDNSWQIFSSIEGLRLEDDDKVPVWLDCLYSSMKPFIHRISQLAISELCQQNRTTTKSFKFTAISSLPCGCEVTKETITEKQKDKTELIFSAFEQVLRSLTSTLHSIPRILFKIFNKIEGDLRQLKLTSDNVSSAGLKILGSMLFRSFSGVNAEDISEGIDVNDSFTESCSYLAQLLYHVMAGDLEGFCDRAGLPIALETTIISKKDWIMEQVKKINEIISGMDEEPKQEPGQDHFMELQFDIKAKNFLLHPKGEQSLKQIYLFCQNKKDWILRRIPIASHLGSLQQIPSKPRTDTFDPLHAYGSLGDYPFDHNGIEKFPFDWEQMLQSNIGMPLKSVKRLVYNRCELQNEKNVDEDKLEILEKLKTFYDRDSDEV